MTRICPPTTARALSACLATVLAALGTLLAGPAQAAVDLPAARAELTLAEEPAEPAAILDVRRELEAIKRPDGSADLEGVVVAGQIGGMPNPWADTHPDFPWYAGQASFFAVDLATAAEFANHAKSHGGDVDCPFCRRKATKSVGSIVVVNFVDDEGKILKADVRQLFDLKEGDQVVVRGQAQLLGGNFVVINADGIYVRP